MTFEQHLQAKGHSKATCQAYTFQLLDHLTWLDKEGLEAEAVTTRDLTSWLHYLQQKGQVNSTRRNALIAVRHFYDWQIQRGQREDNPADPIKIRGAGGRKLYPILSKEELETMYHRYDLAEETDARANRNWFQQYRLSRQRNKVMLGLMIYQGLLTSEVNDLMLQDLKLKEGTVFIAGGRTSNERTLDLKPQQIIEMMEYLLQTRKELIQQESSNDQLLFLPATPYNKMQTATNALNVWKRLSQDVAAQHPRFINFLQVRTSVITHWLKQYNLREVQYKAGHRYVSTTEGYLINQMEDLQSDIDEFHPIG
ncbi:MAG TPA: site-specific integrase [Flavipsychrobacter sp.]|nr:site-specific integrase [Flavipsychrobacter sp.]